MPAETYSDNRIDAMLAELKPIFMKQFDATGEDDVEWLSFTFAPGRLNIIGEHVDYLDGWVCPAALTEGTHILAGRVKHAAAIPGAGGKLRFYATYNNAHYDIDHSSSESDHKKDWKTYVCGAVTLRLQTLGLQIGAEQLKGVCFVLHSTLAMGAGMSASAAFSVGLIHALDSVATGKCVAPTQAVAGRRYCIQPPMPTAELVALAKEARRIEIEFCGVNVGIMDQFASALSTAGQFMFLDCSDCSFETFSLEPLLGNTYCFMLIDSMNKHELAGGNASVYNQVRKDLEEAQRHITEDLFKGEKTFTFSAFVRNPSSFSVDGKHYSPNNRLQIMEDARKFMSQGEYERGCYQLGEQERTLLFKELTDAQHAASENVTQESRAAGVGKLLNETHAGLRDFLRVSTAELDFIQELVAADPDGVGARVMGAGFGGCVIALVKRSAAERIAEDVKRQFKEKFNVENVVYPVDRLSCGVFSVALASHA